MAKDPIIPRHKGGKLCFSNLVHTRHPYVTEWGNTREAFIYRVFSGREEALKMASEQSWEKSNLSLKPERPKKAEQLFLVQVAGQAPQHHVPGLQAAAQHW